MTILHIAAASAALLAPLSPGPHAVGFRIIAHVDGTRPALPPASGQGRQIPIAVWYPARPARDSRVLRVRDYVFAAAETLSGSRPSEPSTTSE